MPKSVPQHTTLPWAAGLLDYCAATIPGAPIFWSKNFWPPSAPQKFLFKRRCGGWGVRPSLRGGPSRAAVPVPRMLWALTVKVLSFVLGHGTPEHTRKYAKLK